MESKSDKIWFSSLLGLVILLLSAIAVGNLTQPTDYKYYAQNTDVDLWVAGCPIVYFNDIEYCEDGTVIISDYCYNSIPFVCTKHEDSIILRQVIYEIQVEVK
jgi:hypothetical protein